MKAKKRTGKTWFCICRWCGKTGNFDPDFVRSRGLCPDCGDEVVWHGRYEGKYRDLLDAEIEAFKKAGVPKKSSRRKKAEAAEGASWRTWWEPKHTCPHCRRQGERVLTYLPTNNSVKCVCGECGKFVKFLPAKVAAKYAKMADLQRACVTVVSTQPVLGEEE